MFDKEEHKKIFLEETPALIVNFESYNEYSKEGYWGVPDPKPNGSCFWAPGKEIDKLIDLGDSNLIEHMLGFDPGTLENTEVVVIKDYYPEKHNLRIATGEEPGANGNFTGKIDGVIVPEAYNGKTSGGIKEIVSDRAPLSDMDDSFNKKLFTPMDRSQIIIDKYDYILKEGGTNKAKKDINEDIEKLKGKIESIQDYIAERIEMISKDKTNIELEKQRNRDNISWLSGYSKELSQLKTRIPEPIKLQEQVIHRQNIIGDAR